MIVSIVNSKGGVGKSTIAVHLATWLAQRGYQVALLDADKQRSSSVWMAEADRTVVVYTADSPSAAVRVLDNIPATIDFVIADGPAGLDEISRTLLLLSSLALFPITPSVLDLRSVASATDILREARRINGGRPEARLILNKMRTRDTTSRELLTAAPTLGMIVAKTIIRDLKAFRDAPQLPSVVSRMGRTAKLAANDADHLCCEMFGIMVEQAKTVVTHG